jgi:hypothetical protein
MSIVIDQVEPQIIEHLDLDLSQYGLPTQLNQLAKDDVKEN